MNERYAIFETEKKNKTVNKEISKHETQLTKMLPSRRTNVMYSDCKKIGTRSPRIFVPKISSVKINPEPRMIWPGARTPK